LLIQDYSASYVSVGNKKTNVVTTQIYYDSVVLRNLIEWLKENLISTILESKNFGKSFLQGIFDGEGSVNVRKKERSVKLVLEMKNPLVLDAIRYILYQNRIDSKKSNSNEYLIYTATRDYLKIKELQPFRFNLKNKQKFSDAEKIVKRLQTFKGGLFFELLDYMQLHHNYLFKLDKLYASIGRKGRANIHFLSAINKAIGLKLIERRGRGTRWEPYQHRITKRGIDYITKEKFSKMDQFICLKSNICRVIQNRWKNGC